MPRRSSKVIIAETPTNIVPRPAITKKSLLKSTSKSSSVDKPVILDVKATEIRSSIPEDFVGEEISKQSTSSAISDQEKKVEGKENTQEQQRQKDGETSEKGTLKEEKEEERTKDENKCQQLRNTEGNNSNNIEQESSETNKEIDAEKEAKSDTKERKSEIVPVQTTKLRGKSKATGQVLGGWI